MLPSPKLRYTVLERFAIGERSIHCIIYWLKVPSGRLLRGFIGYNYRNIHRPA